MAACVQSSEVLTPQQLKRKIYGKTAVVRIKGSAGMPDITYSSREGQNKLFHRSSRVDRVTAGNTYDDSDLLDGASKIVPSFFPAPVRDIKSPSRRTLLSTQSCPADIQASELRTYSITNGGDRRLESRESTKMRHRKRTGRRERPSLLTRLSEEAKEVMKEIREEMEREKITKSTHMSIMSEPNERLSTQLSDSDHFDRSESEAQTTIVQIEDDLSIRSVSDAVSKQHKLSIVSSTGSATNSMTTESRSTVFTDSERDLNGSTSDDRAPTPPDSTRASTGCRTSLLDNAIIEEEEFAINFDVQRNKFTTLTATPLVPPKPRLPRSHKRDSKTHQGKLNYSGINNRLYNNKRNRNVRRQVYNFSHPGEYTESRPYRKTPPVPSHILKKIRQVNVEDNSTPSPTPSPPPPPPPPVQPRLYKERSFQVTGPGYDIRYHQPLYYNYHPQLDPVEKKLQTESVEKCRAWLDKWVISE